MSGSPKERIEKLKSRLYSRDYDNTHAGDRSTLPEHDHTGPEDWNSGDKIPELLMRSVEGKKQSTWAKRIFVGSLLFFVVAAAVALFMFLGGLNTVSSKNVDIEVGGPISIAAGEVQNFELTIKNSNNVTLGNVVLYVTYPEGARDPQGTELTGRQRIALADIDSGSSLRQTISFIAYGEKESIQTINLSLEYSVPGSNATFVKEKVHEVTISSAPLIIDIDYPEEVTSGQFFNFDVIVSSNSTSDLKNVVVKMEPPFGFTLESSEPEGSADNTWNLGNFKPAEKKTLTLGGRVQGQDKDERSFRFYIGKGTEDGMDIDTELLTSIETVTIRRPFISLANSINGQSGSEIVVRGASSNSGVIRWQNTTSDRLTDLVIDAELVGLPLDKSSVRVQGGFYQSGQDKIIWDKSTNPALASIDVGGQGSLVYNFNTKQGNFTESDGIIEILLRARAVRVTGTTREVISSETTQRVRLAANIGISGRAVYSTGPFTNTGPVPPRAEQATTYTILLSAGAGFGDITNTTLTAKLPLAVEWLGVASPSSESVSYNANNRTVTWSLGTVREGTGSTRASRELAFQVRLTPSLSQVNSLATLVEDIEINGRDDRAGTNVLDSIQQITTSLSTDPQFNQQDGVVVK